MKNYPACKDLNPHKILCGPTLEIRRHKSIGRMRVNSSWNNSCKALHLYFEDNFKSWFKYSKISNKLHFYFSDKIVVIIRPGINKILVRIANREDPDQTASSEAV